MLKFTTKEILSYVFIFISLSCLMIGAILYEIIPMILSLIFIIIALILKINKK